MLLRVRVASYLGVLSMAKDEKKRAERIRRVSEILAEQFFSSLKLAPH